jgi:hypothetical protein
LTTGSIRGKSRYPHRVRQQRKEREEIMGRDRG